MSERERGCYRPPVPETVVDGSEPCEADTPVPPFAVGDVVRLKSGGPAMTVTFTTGSPGADIECTWFDGIAELRRFFATACLERYSEGGIR